MGLKLSEPQLQQISNNLTKSWRFWIQFSVVFLVALFLFGVPAVTVIGVHYATKSLNASLTNFNVQASNKLATAYQDVTNRISSALQSYEQRANNQLAAAHQDITNRIAKEFEPPRIQEIVAQVAATQASNLLSRQISPEINSFRSGTSNTLVEFGNSLLTFQKESTNALADVRAATEFSLLVAKALSDDYGAFEQLKRIAESQNSSFKQLAADTVNAVLSRTEMECLINSSTLGPNWGAIGIDPATNSLEQLRHSFFTQPNKSITKFFLLNQIFGDNRFPQADRFDFLASVMSSDSSVILRFRACFLMNQEAKLNENVFGISDYLAWWSANRSRFTNTPATHP